MDLIQLISYRGQGVPPRVFNSINGNGDLAIFNICLHQGFVLADLQHNARAPGEMIFNLLVHEDNEAGDDAGWQNGIVILKSRDAVEFRFGGFIFGEQVISIFLLDVFHTIKVFEMFILCPKDGVICAGSGKDEAVCHR